MTLQSGSPELSKRPLSTFFSLSFGTNELPAEVQTSII